MRPTRSAGTSNRTVTTTPTQPSHRGNTSRRSAKIESAPRKTASAISAATQKPCASRQNTIAVSAVGSSESVVALVDWPPVMPRSQAPPAIPPTSILVGKATRDQGRNLPLSSGQTPQIGDRRGLPARRITRSPAEVQRSRSVRRPAVE